MLLILLLVTAVLADRPVKRSGREVAVDAGECLANAGYLSAADVGEGNCCQFVACNDANNNKTGFVGTCMGGTVWNQDIKGCDSEKYVPGCVAANDCPVVAKRTGAPCSGLGGDQCCAGPGEGNEPIFNADPNDLTRYRVEGDPWWAACPEGTEFDAVDECACLSTAEPVAPCDQEGDYFRDDANFCCGYLQCWANRTGVYNLMCMGGSQWNDVNKTCDLNSDDMDQCMQEVCNAGPTDPPCTEDLHGGDCCAAGNFFVGVDEITYQIIFGPAIGDSDDRVQCCPLNMDGLQMTFNSSVDVCCCEDPVEV